MERIEKFLFLAAFLAVLSHFVVRTEVTDKDLEDILGVDLKAAKKVSWKDWVNSIPNFGHPAVAGIAPTGCVPDIPIQGALRACCNGSSNCNEAWNLECQNGSCSCKDGYYPTSSGFDCERRPKLGEPCNIHETCLTYQSTCINFTCSCENPTMQIGEGCASTDFGYCCKNQTHCNGNLGLTCIDGICECKVDYFLNENGSACEFRPRKELGEKCITTDNCYAAFAWCAEGAGICKCKSGFVKVNDACRPEEYSCPFKRPWTPKSNATIPWPCLPNSTRSGCPKDYTCLTPAPGARPRFLTRSGLEQSYCCPPVPDLNMTSVGEKFFRMGHQAPFDIFEPVCLYGKACKDNCQMNEPNAHYFFPGIGMGVVTCPLPCISPPFKQSVIKNGKCVGYERYLRSNES